MTINKQRLYWQCRRGMKELDVLLEGFLSAQYDGLAEAEQAAFVALLACGDQELYQWFLGQGEPSDKQLAAMVVKIREFQHT